MVGRGGDWGRGKGPLLPRHDPNKRGFQKGHSSPSWKKDWLLEGKIDGLNHVKLSPVTKTPLTKMPNNFDNGLLEVVEARRRFRMRPSVSRGLRQTP
ncbi:hypothetical protein E2C01_088188 [Portunus trituberculatus]|uniref:Uncharacterized protein n=1 Tax=Portunus trituberculatus TaxID=210409 RepID=A0A5B7JA35_PORTR|nr:hypothetical protein [Portunus trituberculatus]